MSADPFAPISTPDTAESLELLDGGGQAYPRMLLALEQARRSIHLEVYAFELGGVGESFREALARAAARRVAVNVVIDGWGSARDGLSVAAALREAGCTVRIHNRLAALLIGRFGRNHRKILLVDDEVAFLGGINIGDENVSEAGREGWADLALEIRGPVCASLGQMIRREPQSPVHSSLRIFLCGLGGGWRLRRRYLRSFAEARQRIHIAHGYFLPDRGVVRAITAAARRGVQVRLLLAGRSDVPFARAATRSLYRRLLAAGVGIHEWGDSVLHAKVATVDGRRLLVGSFNLDPFSMANLEALVEVADTRIVAQGEDWIQDHFAGSTAMSSMQASSLPQRWLFDPFGRLVARGVDAISRVIARQKRRRTSGPSRWRSSPIQLSWARRRIGKAGSRWLRGGRGRALDAEARTVASSFRVARTAVIAVVGSSVLAFGVALLVLPGPAVLVIPLGLGILATEFVWAGALLHSGHRHLERLRLRAERVLGRPLPSRGRGGPP